MRVIAMPLSIQGMPAESLEAFSRAIGHTFQIEGFDQAGCLHLDMYPKVSCDFICIEPFCVSRFRRYRRLSKAFQKKREVMQSPEEPRLEIEFEARLRQGVNPEAFGLALVAKGTGGGFAIWPEDRKVKGCITVESANPEAKSILEAARTAAENLAEAEKIEVSEVRSRNES